MATEKRHVSWPAVIGTASGLLVGIMSPVGNAVDLWHKLFPTPAEQAGTIDPILIERHVTFGEFLKSTAPLVAKGVIDGSLQAQKVKIWQTKYDGAVLRFRVHLKGFTGARCPIFWTVLFNGSGKEVTRNRTLLFQEGYPTSEIHPTSDTYSQIAEEWVPYPGRPGTYKARIYLFGHIPPRGELDEADSPPFQVVAH